ERGAGGGEKKDRRIAARPDDGAGDGTGNPQRQIDKRRINGQGRAAVLGGHVAHGFHAQRGKYQRKAEAGDGGAEVRQRRRRREREQKKSGALDPQRQKRDSITAPATNGPGKKQARDDETAGEERERPAGVGPVAARVEKRDERSDGAEAETGQGETRAVGQHPAQHLAKAQAIAALDAHRSQRRGPEKSDQRERDRGCADGAGAGASFEPETAGSAGGQSAVGGDAGPGNHLRRVWRADPADAPERRAGGNSAFADAEQKAARDQHAQAHPRILLQPHRRGEQQAAGGADHQADAHGLFRAGGIAFA